MSSLQIEPLAIDGAALVTSRAFKDARGSFARFFCETELQPLLGGRRIVAVNCSQSDHVGTVRGLHFQHAPHGEMKLVRCLAGRVFDVIVDVRAHAPTFLHSVSVELDPASFRMLVIPEGFAHGFQVLEGPATLLYLHTAPHMPEAEGGLCPTDPRLGIDWPLPVACLSDRDAGFPLLDDTFRGYAP